MARMNAKHGNKMVKVNVKNGENKMAKMSAKHEDKMVAEPCGWHKLHSRKDLEKLIKKLIKKYPGLFL